MEQSSLVVLNRSYAFDSHIHLSSPQFSDDEVFQLLQRAHGANLKAVMNVATDQTSWERSLSFSSQMDRIEGLEWYQAAATTPHEASYEDPFFTTVEKAASQGLIQAIGETGLDYFYEHSPKETQRDLFIRYIELALRYSLPLIIHCRDAFSDFFSILKSEGQGKARGVLHCFTGTKEDARRLIDMGWFVSISGIATYSKSTEELREVVRFLPSNQFLVETDAPYLAPHPKRGKKNEPQFLLHTIDCIAKLRGVSIDEVAQTTYENAKTLFGEIGERARQFKE